MKLFIFVVLIAFVEANMGNSCFCREDSIERCPKFDEKRVICNISPVNNSEDCMPSSETLLPSGCYQKITSCEKMCAFDVQGNLIHFQDTFTKCETQCEKAGLGCLLGQAVNAQCFNQMKNVFKFGYKVTPGKWTCGWFEFNSCSSCACGQFLDS